MANRFEQVDELQPDAITLVLEQRTDGRWAKVHAPATTLPPAEASVSRDAPPFEALVAAVKLANERKLALVVLDPDAIWKPEWGALYRWEDEPEGESGEA